MRLLKVMLLAALILGISFPVNAANMGQLPRMVSCIDDAVFASKSMEEQGYYVMYTYKIKDDVMGLVYKHKQKPEIFVMEVINVEDKAIMCSVSFGENLKQRRSLVGEVGTDLTLGVSIMGSLLVFGLGVLCGWVVFKRPEWAQKVVDKVKSWFA